MDDPMMPTSTIVKITVSSDVEVASSSVWTHLLANHETTSFYRFNEYHNLMTFPADLTYNT